MALANPAGATCRWRDRDAGRRVPAGWTTSSRGARSVRWADAVAEDRAALVLAIAFAVGAYSTVGGRQVAGAGHHRSCGILESGSARGGCREGGHRQQRNLLDGPRRAAGGARIVFFAWRGYHAVAGRRRAGDGRPYETRRLRPAPGAEGVLRFISSRRRCSMGDVGSGAVGGALGAVTTRRACAEPDIAWRGGVRASRHQQISYFKGPTQARVQNAPRAHHFGAQRHGGDAAAGAMYMSGTALRSLVRGAGCMAFPAPLIAAAALGARLVGCGSHGNPAGFRAAPDGGGFSSSSVRRLRKPYIRGDQAPGTLGGTRGLVYAGSQSNRNAYPNAVAPGWAREGLPKKGSRVLVVGRARSGVPPRHAPGWAARAISDLRRGPF